MVSNCGSEKGCYNRQTHATHNRTHTNTRATHGKGESQGLPEDHPGFGPYLQHGMEVCTGVHAM